MNKDEDKNIQKDFRYLVDLTLLNKLEEPGVDYQTMFSNLETILADKVREFSSIHRRPIPDRKMEYRYLPRKIGLHQDAIDVWAYFRRTWGAGCILNIAMKDSIVAMKSRGFSSFNQYCDDIRSKERMK